MVLDTPSSEIKRKVLREKSRKSLREVLLDKNLAGLGDAYLNFIYSLAGSEKNGKPLGLKASGKTLAEAIKRAGLRELLPSRIDRHDQGDAAEALILYVWLCGKITIDECIDVLEKNLDDPIKAFTELLIEAKKRLEVLSYAEDDKV